MVDAEDIEKNLVEDMSQEEESPAEEENTTEESSFSEEEESTEEEKPVKKEINPKTRIHQLQKEKYQAIHRAREREEEARRLREENEALKKTADIYNQAAMGNYDQALQLRIQQAEELLSRSIQEGDVKEQSRAIAELSKASSEAASLSAWKAQQQIPKQTEPENRNNEPPRQQSNEYMSPEAVNWFRQNTWCDPNSEHFDEFLASEADEYAGLLNNQLQRAGQGNRKYTKEYFDKINRHIQEIRSEYGYEEPEPVNQKSIQQNRNLNMKPTSSNTSAPTGNAPRGPKNNAKVSLSQEEKDMARTIGMKEEEYAKYIKLDKEFIAARGGR